MPSKEALTLWDFGFMVVWLERQEDTSESDIMQKAEDQNKKEIFVMSKLFFMKNNKKNFWMKSQKDIAHLALPMLLEEFF